MRDVSEISLREGLKKQMGVLGIAFTNIPRISNFTLLRT